MTVPVPDPLLWRRVAALERQVQQLETTLRRMSVTRSITPLSARLWRATLNEAFGATTAHVAAADLLSIVGTDTGLDISLFDPLDMHTALATDDGLYALEQIDVDGTRRFVPLQSLVGGNSVATTATIIPARSGNVPGGPIEVIKKKIVDITASPLAFESDGTVNVYSWVQSPSSDPGNGVLWIFIEQDENGVWWFTGEDCP
jgi:hypothetical protein